ncbi:uncharacterized protein LOC111082080 isoform X2 [Drosophila obscura]|nr:uncharacterized protein LOC111082080 isoform X2 [Drosophila obscura]XP_022233952.1 uncharacterized protein LOC111082080 isoform X2 [Drosophila obscura]
MRCRCPSWRLCSSAEPHTHLKTWPATRWPPSSATAGRMPASGPPSRMTVSISDEGPLPRDAPNHDVEVERRGPRTGGRKLCDVHNYYKEFLPHLKAAAFEVIDSKDYKNEKEIIPKFSTVPTTSGVTLVKVQLNVDFENC